MINLHSLSHRQMFHLNRKNIDNHDNHHDNHDSNSNNNNNNIYIYIFNSSNNTKQY